MNPRYLSTLTLLGVVASAQTAPSTLRFRVSGEPVSSGFTQIAVNTLYNPDTGYGFEPGAHLIASIDGAALTSDQPFFFSARVPEGNYTVKLTLGDPSQTTTTTVKAESGRLLLERLDISAGQTAERTFTVNVRTPHLPKLPLNATGREEVTLDQFDRGNTRDWDDKLTLEILGPHTAIRSIEIVPAPAAPTIFLAGDSTVTDRDGGQDVSWGQLLPRFFAPGIAIANHAQSGETLKSFANALRLDKILSQMKRGDFLLLQFAHNDSKASWPQTYVEPATTYKAWLRVYIAEVRLRGATPILVTPMDRGDRITGAPTHGHGGYPEALRELSREENVPLIDLYTMSTAFYQAAGPDAPKILADGTHSTAYGGYEFARAVATSIRRQNLDLARFLAPGLRDFDPTHPDSAATLDLNSIFPFTPRPPRPVSATPRTTTGSGDISPGPLARLLSQP